VPEAIKARAAQGDWVVTEVKSVSKKLAVTDSGNTQPKRV
jgi:hypothetical protein